MSIDGDDLWGQVAAQIAPVIAGLEGLEDRLNRVQSQYRRTGNESTRSSEKQTASLRAATRAANELADKYSQIGRRAVESAGLAEAAVDQVTRAWERQTRAINQNTAARAANAATPTGGPPSGGSRGGGGGGGGRGGGGGLLRTLTSTPVLNLGALGVAGLPAAATAATQLVGAVQNLIQVGGVAPAVLAALGTSAGVAKLGLSGVSDAVKTLSDSLKDGATPAQLKKAQEALKDLSPEAVEVATSIAKINIGPLKDLKKELSGKLLTGVAAEIDQTVGKLGPRLTSSLGNVASAQNGVVKQVLASIGDDKNFNLIDRMFGNTAEGTKRATAAIDPIVHSISQLVATGSDFLPRLGDAVTKVAQRFDNFITKAAASGDLFKWIEEGIDGARDLGNSLLNIGKIITGLTSAAGGDGGLLKWLADFTGKWSAFVNSPAGQKTLSSFFDEGGGDLKSIFGFLRDMGPVIGQIVQGFSNWGQVIAPIIVGLGDALAFINKLPGGLAAVVTGFLAWKTIGGIIGGITTKLTAMRAASVSAGGAGPGGIGGIFAKGNRLQTGMVGIGIAGAGTALQQNAGDSAASQALGALGTIGGSALTGAALGSVIPGVGTAIGAAGGAAVGAVLAGVNFLMNENANAAKAAADAQATYAESVAQSAAALANLQGAQKEVNDSLLAAGGDLTNTGVQQGIQAQLGALPDSLKSHYGDQAAEGVAKALQGTGLSTAELAQQVTGSQPIFDALEANLSRIGPDGALAAQQLQLMRDQILGMQTQAQAASPALTQLATDLHLPGASDALAAVRTAVLGIPTNVPIALDMPNAPATLDILKGLGYNIQEIDGKEVVVNADDQKVRDADAALEALGIKITHLPTGQISVAIDQNALNAAQQDMNNFFSQYQRLIVQPTVQPPGLPTPPGPPQNPLLAPYQRPGGADGMVIPGYAPKRDIVNAVLAPGEGVLIPEAVRGLGGAPGVYALNSRFRRGLSTRYYADGGVNPDGTPIAGDDNSELGVLRQIRDLLSGGGGTGAPLNKTAAGVSGLADGTAKGAAGTTTGPFGTPIKPRNRGYEMAAAAIQALGGDPEKFLGADPTTIGVNQGGMLPVAGAGGLVGGAPINAAALQKFAMSGNTADLPPGLSINDPVVTAITAARNKSKGLGDDQISDLIGQALGPGGFQGVLDPQNTALVKALSKFATKGATPARGAAAVPGLSSAGLMTALPGGVPAGSLDAFAQAASGGKYQWGASDLAAGLSDCSGAISDLVELITKGQADSGRLFSTADAGSVLKGLGAVDGAVPGMLQIGWSDSHMRATLPSGVNFESGGQTGQGATYGGNAQGAAGMPNIMSLPAGALAGMPGMAGLGAGGGTGTPVFVTNWPGGGGGLAGQVGQQMLGAGLGAAGQAGAGVAGDVLSGIAGGLGPDIGNNVPNADLAKLVEEKNPMALFAALGFNVADFTKQGGGGQDFQGPDSPFDASGRLFSDTSALSDRTSTSLAAQIEDMKKQLQDAVDQVSDKLTEDALKPIITSAIQSGMEGLKDSVSAAIGTSLGTAAAPPIADAVSSAVASLPIDNTGSGNVGGSAANVVTGIVGGAATGGAIVGPGTGTSDSILARLSNGEYVVTAANVRRAGGFGAMAAWESSLPGYATGGGVNVNDTVGAEFFGVSEVPILGAIVNLLVRVLLKVLGVNIEARDTLTEMTSEFRQFRGDFEAFDASGRLMNDTSALVERSSTSEQEAAQERIRILKIVIEALIKYIIEKVIVPIAKAVANAAIQAGASAAGAAVNTQAPGAGGIVSSLISSAGMAGVDIAAEVGTDFALAISSTLIDALGDAIISQGGDLATGIFGGGAIQQLLVGPLTGSITDPILAAIGGLTGGLGTLFGGLLGAASFDSGGVASGMGMMPKATIAPERVLSPSQTGLFERMVMALERGGAGGGDRTVEVHAPITVHGGPDAGDNVRSKLLELIN